MKTSKKLLKEEITNTEEAKAFIKVNNGDLGTDEYIFDTFEDVSKWVENRYWEIKADAEKKEATL